MSRFSDPVWRERRELAGDAWLLTAGLVGVFFAVDLVVFWVGDMVGAPQLLMEALSSLTFLACVIVGPLIALRLHGHRIDWTLAAGGFLGIPLGGAVVLAVAMSVGLVSRMLVPVTSSEFIVPIIFVGVAGVLLVAVTAALLRDAVRDLRAQNSLHRGLDIARIIALVSVLIIGGASIYTLVQQFGSEAGEGVVWAMFAGFVAAAIALSADLFSKFMAARKAPEAGGAVGPA